MVRERTVELLNLKISNNSEIEKYKNSKIKGTPHIKPLFFDNCYTKKFGRKIYSIFFRIALLIVGFGGYEKCGVTDNIFT